MLRTVAAFLVVLAAGALLGSAITQWRPPDEADPVPVQSEVGERIRVEVLNAGGRRHMARRATDLLRSRGFDVVYFGNAEHFGQDTSAVLDRVGRTEAARAVAGALGIPAVRTDIDRNLYLDVTVRLGSEWEPGKAPADTGDPDTAPGWRLRDLFQ